MDEQHEINVKVSDNLTKLAGQYNALNGKVDSVTAETKKLAEKVKDSEDKHKIDLRDIEKEGKINILKKYGIPFGLGASITILPQVLTELIKFF